jgi:hypothetical protein
VDRLCGLMASVPGYTTIVPGSIPGATTFVLEVVGLERGPFSLVSTTEEIFGRKRSGSSLENRDYGCRESAALTTLHLSICKSWH